MDRLAAVLPALVHRSDDHDRRLTAVGGTLQLLADLEAVLLRQHGLDQREVGPLAIEDLDARETVLREHDLIARTAERIAQLLDASRLIVDDEYPGFENRHGLSRAI